MIFRLHPATPASGVLGQQQGLVVFYIEESLMSHSRPSFNWWQVMGPIPSAVLRLTSQTSLGSMRKK